MRPMRILVKNLIYVAANPNKISVTVSKKHNKKHIRIICNELQRFLVVTLLFPSVKASTGRGLSMPRWVKGAADTKLWNRQSDAFNQTRITLP